MRYKSEDGRTCFVDEGPRIVLQEQKPPADTMEAALRIAAAKYGNQVEITGTAQFREQAARMATRLGIRVQNEDLQNIVDSEKDNVTKERKQYRANPGKNMKAQQPITSKDKNKLFDKGGPEL